MRPLHRVTTALCFTGLLFALLGARAQGSRELPPPPAPLNVPRPAPKTGEPYSPQAILPGGVVIPLYPPESPHLNRTKISEPEVYQMWGPTTLGAVVSIHNPSIEFHPGNGQVNTGAAIILAAGGGHRSLNVGSEAAPLVPFFSNYGISTIILRNRLRSDGYDPKVDGARDALQAIKLVRAYAQQWNLDPNKIGIMGFSAGAELAALASLQWEEYDQQNALPGNPLAGVSSRPDFAALIYPGPSPFARGGTARIPRAATPAFIATPGWGDWIHALWATEYFTALFKDGVPNMELHVYARGRHPGDKVGPGEPAATGGLAWKGGIAFDGWSEHFLQWFRDLGFMGPPGVETQAARDVAANVNRTPKEDRPR
jgi:acetyl esterase/lipase